MEHQTLFNDPDFAGYVFNCMQTATKDRVLELDPADLLHFSSVGAMRRFADRASLEERLRILSLLGISFCLVASPPGDGIKPLMDDVYGQYTVENRRAAIVEAMAKQKLFVVSSRDVLMSAHIAAVNSHSRLYTVNSTYLTIRSSLSKLEKYLAANRYPDAEKALQQLARIAYTTLLFKDVPQSITGLTPAELSLLLVLYQKRNSFIDGPRIREILDQNMLEGTVARTLIRLEKQHFIQSIKHRKEVSQDFKKRYTIMEAGIIAVNNYLKYLVKQAMDV